MKYLKLDPIIQNELTAERELLQLEAGDCVLVKKEGFWSKNPNFDFERLRIFLDSSVTDAPSIVVKKDMGEWTEAPLYSFNCHTFSIGSFIGIGPDYWIEGVSLGNTNNVNPVESLLKSYFDCVASDAAGFLNVERLRQLGIRDDDVLLFSNMEKNGPAVHIHSSRIKIIDGEFYVLSKYGEAEIFLTPLVVLLEEYKGVFNEFSVHRFQSRESNP